MSEPVSASTIEVQTCEDGAVHIIINGSDGEPAATASMCVHVAMDLLDDFAAAIEIAIAMQAKASAPGRVQ